MKARRFYVYILSDHAGTLHVGVTSNLVLRVFEHKAEQRDAGVTGSGAVRLVYFESTTEVHAALEREKELKRWVRRKKRALIQAQNPTWRDLAGDWFQPPVANRGRVRPAS
jgi:putative endonuclease